METAEPSRLSAMKKSGYSLSARLAGDDSRLPAGLDHAWNLTLTCQGTETNTANPELPEICPWPPAKLTAIIFPNFELWRFLLFIDQTNFCHTSSRLNAWKMVPRTAGGALPLPGRFVQ